ncbi:hypothetical protein CkaCkLH20_13319 [Colletotrichum karsti]|uniref:Uncharacterized protein n=1 Tax=Colletotrichum karsti TaxID=1095194 RepID=A0A9P6HSU9_9PEZI|nr:uncharacterized protein CkaCkLH20_13319 [Colletotrichum karsti]KAF9869210.1 hypothetical protein CkaCkLH20_13319 [Colletotrichum karsti]
MSQEATANPKNESLNGGRIPYDVNAATVPAGLRAAAALAEAGFSPITRTRRRRRRTLSRSTQTNALEVFEVAVKEEEARKLVDKYICDDGFPFSSHSDNITEDVRLYSVVLEGNHNQRHVRFQHCLHHFLLSTIEQAQLTAFVSQTADHILAPYPIGLTTDTSLLVASPAVGNDPIYAANVTNSAYHGTIV